MKNLKKILPPKNNKKVKIKKCLLRLYIAGETPNCLAALNNLKKICETNFPNDYKIEVIDLLKFPHLAREHQILAIPTVIRQLPKPIRKAIGDLSNAAEVLLGLELVPDQ